MTIMIGTRQNGNSWRYSCYGQLQQEKSWTYHGGLDRETMECGQAAQWSVMEVRQDQALRIKSERSQTSQESAIQPYLLTAIEIHDTHMQSDGRGKTPSMSCIRSTEGVKFHVRPINRWILNPTCLINKSLSRNSSSLIWSENQYSLDYQIWKWIWVTWLRPPYFFPVCFITADPCWSLAFFPVLLIAFQWYLNSLSTFSCARIISCSVDLLYYPCERTAPYILYCLSVTSVLLGM